MSMSLMSSKDLVFALLMLALLDVVVNARPVTRTVRGPDSLRG